MNVPLTHRDDRIFVEFDPDYGLDEFIENTIYQYEQYMAEFAAPKAYRDPDDEDIPCFLVHRPNVEEHNQDSDDCACGPLIISPDEFLTADQLHDRLTRFLRPN